MSERGPGEVNPGRGRYYTTDCAFLAVWEVAEEGIS